jgi:class 3 adenylate cyclase/ketosteroid isomerase-like protein
MASTRSPEIESVTRRVLTAFESGDMAAMANLVSTDPSLRVVGFAPDEWWAGPEEFLKVRQTQISEIPSLRLQVEKVDAFEDGAFGWASISTTVITSEVSTAMRHFAVLRLEAGAWKVILWHNSVPVPNHQIFGVDLTTTLDDLVASVLNEEIPLHSAEGTVTLVFTDIVDSTVLAETLGDAAWADVISRHELTIRQVTASQGGSVVKLLGDGSMLAFDSARAAVRAAVDIQRASSHSPFRVRIGVHTGEVIRTGDDLLGLTVNKAARVAAAADSGAVMISSTTKDLIGSLDGIRMGEPRIVALKGLSDTHQIVPIEWE